MKTKESNSSGTQTWIEVGDIVTPKANPELESKVSEIKPFAGETVYVLENGTRYTENELE